MRFLIFNLAVGAAIFYLVSGGSGPSATPAATAQKAIAAVARLAEAATGNAAPAKEATPVVRDAAVTAPKPAPVPSGKPGTSAAASPQPRAATAEAATSRPAEAETGLAPPAWSDSPASATQPAAQYVAGRPVHAAPPQGQSARSSLVAAKPAAIARPVSKDPDVLERRAEVLRVPARSARPTRFALKEGEALMSPGDRMRELSRLVDDMEAVYFNSLGN